MILQLSLFVSFCLWPCCLSGLENYSLSRVNIYISLSFIYLFIYLFSFIFISWRLITLQYCSGFCHTLTWISHGFTCSPHPDPPSHLPLDPIPLGLPSAPGLSTCLMHPTWAGDLHQPFLVPLAKVGDPFSVLKPTLCHSLWDWYFHTVLWWSHGTSLPTMLCTP